MHVIIAGSAVLARIADQCHQQGLKARLVQNGAQSLPAWTTDPAFNGLLVVDNFAPFFADDMSAQKAYRDALAKYQPSMVNSPTDNSYSEAAWLDGQLISAAAKSITGDITAGSLKTALYGLKGETLGGMVFCLSASLAAVAGVLDGGSLGILGGDGYQPILSLQLFALVLLTAGDVPWYALLAAFGQVLAPAYISTSPTVGYALTLAFGLSSILYCGTP